MKKILAIILCLATVLSLCACTSLKKYTFGGFSVKLPKTFVPTEDTPYTAHLRDGDVFVWAIKDDFTNLDGSELWSEKEYANTLYQLNESKNPTPITEENGVIYFEYSAFSEAKQKTFTYFTTMYKANDAFYMVQFVCEDAEYESYKPKFIKWAKTVNVK